MAYYIGDTITITASISTEADYATLTVLDGSGDTIADDADMIEAGQSGSGEYVYNGSFDTTSYTAGTFKAIVRAAFGSKQNIEAITFTVNDSPYPAP